MVIGNERNNSSQARKRNAREIKTSSGSWEHICTGIWTEDNDVTTRNEEREFTWNELFRKQGWVVNSKRNRCREVSCFRYFRDEKHSVSYDHNDKNSLSISWDVCRLLDAHLKVLLERDSCWCRCDRMDQYDGLRLKVLAAKNMHIYHVR